MNLLAHFSCRIVRFALTSAALAVALPALAQFNGPGSTAGSAEINRPVTVTTDQTILYPATHDVLLSPGDLITIHVFGQADYIPVVRVGTDGNALLPLIGIQHLEGLSVTQAEELIALKLVEGGFYRNPQVTMQITEGPNAVVTVVGEAHGIVPVVGTRRLLDVLTSLGGLPATASHVVTINRPGVEAPIVVDLGREASIGNGSVGTLLGIASLLISVAAR
jgi:polysaccharide export outer membrane protein